MNLLFRILYAQKCSSTHHRLAMDALRYLKASDADAWCRLFLVEIEQYIDGSKAPDKKFRDFRNHVLHVRDNFWGGAVPAAELWYKRLVSCLRDLWLSPILVPTLTVAECPHPLLTLYPLLKTMGICQTCPYPWFMIQWLARPVQGTHRRPRPRG